MAMQTGNHEDHTPYNEAHQLATEIADRLARLEELGFVSAAQGRISYPGGTLTRRSGSWTPIPS